MTASLRKGWCPGVLRPMETGDGLLVRLRLTGGILGMTHAHAIANCANRYGNGLIGLSSRANLQLRGIVAETLEELTAELNDHRLIDSDAEVEAIRNIVASPLAGIDPDAAIDIRPLVEALEAELAGSNRLHQLPGKFGFLIDNGGHLSLAQVEADVRFEAFKTPSGPRFAIRLAGADNARIGECAPDEVPRCAAGLAEAFLALRGDTVDAPRRMRDLVGRAGLAAVAEAAGFRSSGFVSRAPRTFDMREIVGHRQAGTAHYVGAALPFGRLSGETLIHLASLAEQYGATELRLTPWRAILVVGAPERGAANIASELNASGLILDAGDPRLHVAACPGAPACRNATTSVLADAERLAALLPPWALEGTALHVSGCGKGCAHAPAAPFTLVGNAGRYDLVENGTARDAPSVTGLSDREIQAELSRRMPRRLREVSLAKSS
jgi:precorrin-3B synthase